MKILSSLLLAVILFSCHSGVKQEDLSKLNGYWEIKEVVLSDGQKKEYKINETVDFLSLENNQGFRQKVMPQFDGKFITNGVKESFKIVKEKETFFIEYQTDFEKWKEEIVELEDSLLILKNKDKLQYEYKKFKPYSLK